MISLTTADSALKNVYLDVVANQLNRNIDPIYAKIGQTTQDIAGNTVKKLVSTGINGGIGAGGEVGSLPTARENNYISLTSTLKNLYGSIEISDKAIRASSSEAGAFLNLLNAEMENLIESSKFNYRRMLYGTGDGKVATIIEADTESNMIQVDSANNLAVGMRFNAYCEGELVDELTDVEIIDIDYIKCIVYMDTTLSEDFELEDDTYMYLLNSEGKEFLGLEGLCDSSITTIYGVDRSTCSMLTPLATTGTSTTIPTLLKALDDLRLNSNSETDFIVCGYKFRRNVQGLLKTASMNTDILTLDGGFKSISLAGVPVYASRFCGDSIGYFLNSETFHMHQLCDWTWIANNDGQVLHQKEGYPLLQATLVKYCDLICDRPNTILKFTWSS